MLSVYTNVQHSSFQFLTPTDVRLGHPITCNPRTYSPSTNLPIALSKPRSFQVATLPSHKSHQQPTNKHANKNQPPCSSPSLSSAPPPLLANANANTDADLIPGGYVPHPVTTANVAWLQIALSDAAHNAHNGTNSICIKHINALQTQVVAGTNYRFAVNGCELAPGQYKGYCQQEVQCGRSEFAVTVFSQPWAHTFEVTKIERLLL